MEIKSNELVNIKEFISLYEKVRILLKIVEDLNQSDDILKIYIEKYGKSIDNLILAFNNKINDSAASDERFLINIKLAYNYLYSAGLEVMAFIADRYPQTISSFISKYEIETINTIIPNYFSEIGDEIHKIQKEILVHKSQLDSSDKNNQTFELYFEKTKKLQEIFEDINSKKARLDNIEVRIRRPINWDRIIAIISILGTIITIFITLYFALN